MRAAAAKNIAGYITVVRNEVFSSEVLPLLSTLSQDTAPNVRSTSLSHCLTTLCGSLFFNVFTSGGLDRMHGAGASSGRSSG